MAKDKSSFIFYTDWVYIFDALSIEESGKLIKQMLDYVNDRNPEEMEGLMNAVYAPIRARLKKDLRKWEETREKRAEAGRQGGLAKASKAKQNVANLPVNVNVNVNDNNKEKYKKEKFTQPELKEVAEYFLAKGSTVLEAQKFHGFYESKGWMVGKNKMKSWKGAVGGWLARNKEKEHTDRFKPKFT